MSNSLPYLHVLREIDKLRENGIKDNDPQMIKLRMQLRDHLEVLNKNKPKSVVPTLMSIRTVKLEPKQLKSKPKNPKPEIEIQKSTAIKKLTLGEGKKDHYAKYALFGAIMAVVALGYRWYREKYG